MPDHDFALVREGAWPYGDYESRMVEILASEETLRIDDDLLWYFVDTLEWVPSILPEHSSAWRGRGLNNTGPTIINRAGGAVFSRVFASWAELFAAGPAEIALKIVYSYPWVEDDESDTFGYHVIRVERDPTVETLRALAAFGEQAASGEFFILHLGI